MSGARLIEASHLGAVRGERILYTDVGLDVSAGEIILLRGPNGSGKTTLLRQLAGLSEPQAGRVQRFGDHHWIGHTNGLKPHETPRSHLHHWTKVWGGTSEIDPVLRRMGLGRPADVPTRMLSAGQKRRSALGRLLLVNRPVWLLDEPFNALDADGQALLGEMILAHCAEGGAVIAALHGHAPIEATRELHL
ncbi:MAG: heme ABC exporter ATP-binding protein CcmA [Alphaproteobacteria bacterium]|nr:heme ABC exporter ATP-binding protein CcmA [Alphaproteobacteria bacterium]